MEIRDDILDDIIATCDEAADILLEHKETIEELQKIIINLAERIEKIEIRLKLKDDFKEKLEG